MAFEIASPSPALPRGGTRFVSAIKSFKHVRQIFGGNSRSRVGDGQHRQSVL